MWFKMTWIKLNGDSGIGKTTIVRNLSFELNNIYHKKTENDLLILKKYKKQYDFLIDKFNGCESIYTHSNFEANRFFNISSKKSKRLASVTEIDSYRSNLSQGETQRFILLEALDVEPDLLILDESLSGLPEHYETKILRAIKKIYNGINLLYISHRKSQKIQTLFNWNIEL